MKKNSDEWWIKSAISLAKFAESQGEVPVGAILVFNNKKVSEGWNSSILNNDPTAHAEIIALREGAKVLNNYRLLRTTLYVTLEPCLMCLGAILHSRVRKLVYGACDTNLFYKNIKDKICKKNYRNKLKIITKNSLNTECSNLIKNFFKKKRISIFN